MGYYRKIFKIRGQDSPNVRLALSQIAAGKIPTNETIVPGVLSYEEYLKRRELWDPIMQQISLDAEFYEGSEVLLYPPMWINRANEYADTLDPRRRAASIGIDPAEGGDDTAMAAVDHSGLIDLVSKKTRDTNIIINEVKAFGRKHGVPPSAWFIDRGGGGKQLADRLRSQNFNVKTVGFSESTTISVKEMRRRASLLQTKGFEEHLDTVEKGYAYKNRRAQMYGMLRELLDPAGEQSFGIPREFKELRRQMAPIPLRFDGEGRMMLPPKRQKVGGTGDTLEKLIGCSPDQVDALVLAIYGMSVKNTRIRIGAK